MALKAWMSLEEKKRFERVFLLGYSAADVAVLEGIYGKQCKSQNQPSDQETEQEYQRAFLKERREWKMSKK